jgi:signal transduction histidine kinase
MSSAQPLPNSSSPDPEETPRTGCDPELEELARVLRARGDVESAALAERLEHAAGRIADDSDALKRRLLNSLSVNHDINNALVGVVGNAQLLGFGPAAALPGVKERLEVIAREANRIKQATIRLAELKQTLLIEGRTQGGGRTP